MKSKFYTIFALLLLMAQTDRAEQTVVTLTQAGTLSQHISDAQKYTITDLQIIGPINDDDAVILRDMLNIKDSWGVKEFDEGGNGKLSRLDLSETTIESTDNYGRKVENTLGERMFEQSRNLKSIILPNTLVTIGKYAFQKSGITSIDIPGSVTKIEEKAFAESDLTAFTIPENVAELGNDILTRCPNLQFLQINTKALPRLFTGKILPLAGCPNLNKVVLGKQVEEFSPALFSYYDDDYNYVTNYNYELDVDADNPYLTIVSDVLYNKDLSALFYYSRKKTDTSFTIPETVTRISEYAIGSEFIEHLEVGMKMLLDYSTYDLSIIGDCPNLKSIYWDNEANYRRFGLPASLVTLGKNIQNVENYSSGGNYPFRVDEENPYICAVEGVLFSKDQKTLLIYPSEGTENTEYSLPQGTEVIADYAFRGSSLNAFYLHEGMQDIGRSAFVYCNNMHLYVYDKEPLRLGRSVVYEGNNSTTLHVPAGCRDAYKSTFPWNEFYKIVEFDPTGISNMQTADASAANRYDLSGRKAAAGAKGLHIVRMSDGTVKKVINK